MSRNEQMRIEFSIPHERLEHVREHLDVLRRNAGLSGYECSKPGNVVNLGYTFDVSYIGRIVLEAVNAIAERFPELVTVLTESNKPVKG